MTREERERREQWTKKRLQENARIKTLTMVQHTALMILCEYRHRLHVASDQFYDLTEEAKRCRSFFKAQLPILLRSAGLPLLETDLSFSIPTRDEDGLSEDTKHRICEAYVSGLNEDIEEYLRAIDQKTGTWYAPSGALRLMRESA